MIPSPAKNLILCILSAVLLALPFASGNLWILSWVGFVPLFWALEKKSRAQAFWLAYLAGVIFWAGTIYWLIHVTLPGTIVLVLYLALFFGLFGLFLKNYELLIIPSLWVLLEYLRSYLFTGFPWALLGYSQYLNLPVIQIADITGVWGVSWLVMLVNVAIYQAIGRKQKVLLPIVLLLLSLVYGFYKLHPQPTTHNLQPIKIAVIQGNIPQSLKWNSENNGYIIDKYLYLSDEAIKDKPDLIIWPEAALPVVLEEEPQYYQKAVGFSIKKQVPLLFGAVTKRDELYYNSALLLSSGGKLSGRYDKLHLVPFGEYIPLKKVMPFLETIVPIGDIMRGRDYTVFTQGASKFSVLICFEDLFPELSREFVRRGAGFLINITNDAWYKQTAAPWQHLQASVFRAVENRVTLARAANTGISGFIAATGKIASLVQNKEGRNIFIDGYAAQEVFSVGGRTAYNTFGNFFVAICFFFCIIALLKRKR